MSYKYYSVLRPVGIGTCPDNFIEFYNFQHRTYVDEIGREAWGWVEYAEPLENPYMYDLVPERTTHGGIWVEYDNYFWEVADIKNNKVMLIELITGEMERIIPADVFLRECFSIDYE